MKELTEEEVKILTDFREELVKRLETQVVLTFEKTTKDEIVLALTYNGRVEKVKFNRATLEWEL